MTYICINDKYYEDTEEIREICLYIAQLDRELMFYKAGYKKTLKTIERLSDKIKHYQHLTHVYKVEMNRCVRKLTRIYDTIRRHAMLNYIYNAGVPKPEEVVKIFKEI